MSDATSVAVEYMRELQLDRDRLKREVADLQSRLQALTTERDQAKYGEQDMEKQRDDALSRLAEIERQAGEATEYVLAQINADLRAELDATNDRLTKIVAGLTDEIATRQSRLDLFRKATILAGVTSRWCKVCEGEWAHTRGAELHEDWCPNNTAVVERQEILK